VECKPLKPACSLLWSEFQSFPTAGDEGPPQCLLMSHKDPYCSRLDLLKLPKRRAPRAGNQQLQGTRGLGWTDLLLARVAGEAESLWPS
jgi:hypothetical protein